MTISDQPEREPKTAPGETDLGETTVTVRRSPRIVNFMILGAILGALAAVVLTYAFPENERFNRTQVLGFLLLACVAAGVALASLVALVLARIVSRKGVTVVADRLAMTAPDAGPAVSLTAPDATPAVSLSALDADPAASSTAPDADPAPPTSGTSPSGTTPPDAEPSGSAHPGSPSSSTTSENSK